MNKHLKILILEDSLEDVELIERELKRAGLNFSSMVVNQREDFQVALCEFKPDVVLSDHALPAFNSLEALKIFKQKQTEVNLPAPFILVTGAMSEEFAVQCIKAGIDDYILKDRLKRLPGSIERALEKASLEAERRQYLHQVMANEAMLRQSEHLAQLGSWQADLQLGIHNWSDEMFRILGYEPGEVEPAFERFLNHVHVEDAANLKAELISAMKNLPEYERKCRITTADGQVKYINSKFVVTRNSDNKAVKITGFILDITNLTIHTKKIEEQNEKLREIAWIQSHGVRAPLARIIGLVNLVQNHRTDDKEKDEVLGMIVQSIEELDLLVRAVVRKTEELPG
jgi:PAS domain S-box-containing protein